MFKFNLNVLPFAILNCVTMPIRWAQKGFAALTLYQQAKVMWDTLVRAGHELEDLQATVVRLEKELTAWTMFGAHAQSVIEEHAILKSDNNYAQSFGAFGFPETPEETKKRHDRDINVEMKEAARSCYFIMPGNKFGTLSQGALALKDVIRGPTKDLRTLVSEIEEEGEKWCGSKDKFFRATQRAFIRDFPDRIVPDRPTH